MTLQAADRVRELPPYIFAEIDRLKAEVSQRGIELVDFGVGDPDLPTPPHVIEALARAAADPANHRYPAYAGSLRCRQAAADFYAERFGVSLAPQSEVLTLIGSKEGLAHLPLALINPGELALVPDPAYPVYGVTTRFAGGEVQTYPLLAEQEFLPDLQAIPEAAARRAKLLYINYPNNPTGGVATLADLQRVLEFAERYELTVVSDLAYSEMFYEQPRPPSFLQLPGAKARCIEFYSLSKTYNMTGWRVGFALGAAPLVQALGKIKTNLDSGVFGAVQEAAIAAMTGDQRCVAEMRDTYRRRRDALVAALTPLGLRFRPPKATFYLFAGVPGGGSSLDYAARLLTEAGVVVTPGVGFGAQGEGFVRFALTVSRERIALAATRLAALR